jgi:hypothetical protein
MSEPNVHAPKRWWWVVAVVVPLSVGALAVSPRIIEALRNTGSPPALSDRVVISESTVKAENIVGGDLREGDQIRTDIAIAFGAAMPNLSPEERRLLEGALDRLKTGDYQSAIPILQAVAAKAPTPSLLNNLAAAHLAVGESTAAQHAIEQARALKGEPDLDVQAALNWNERQLAHTRTFGLKPITTMHATQWESVGAYLTRAEDTGGLVTVEAIYRNTNASTATFCPNLHNAYVIDERANKRWNQSYKSAVNCSVYLQPGASFPVWLKFAFAAAEHPRVTVVLPGVLPFEGVRPLAGAGE